MLAMGHISSEAVTIGNGGNHLLQDCFLGFEFCGRNMKGERVMGLVQSCALATTVIADPAFLWKVPDHWTMEQAATVPAAYSTVYYALILRGDMKAGQSILIHAGCGGVGLAAITIALHMGVTVYTTVGSHKKRDFLKKRFLQLADRNIANSRDTSFEQHIMLQTGGKGVDLVLNSLAEEKLQASIRCLATNGKFLEIGKYDVSKNNNLGMSVFHKNVTFHGVFLDNLLVENTKEKEVIVKLVEKGLQSGVIQPLPATVYNENEAEQAFRFLASGNRIGKVMLKIRNEEAKTVTSFPCNKVIRAIPRTYFRADKVYIIIGGIGLELADWMITRGVRKLVLTSRTGLKSCYQYLCISRWEKFGVDIRVSTIDCATKISVTQLLKESDESGPIGGIFNLALVSKIALFESLFKEDFVESCTPKADATKLLDEASRDLCPQLDYFVVFSSVVCGRGDPGLTNYGLANSTMERICEVRKSMGFPGLAIQWGPVGDVGLVAETMAYNIKMKNFITQKISSCLQILDIFLCQGHTVVSSIVIADKRLSGITESTFTNPVSFVANILGITSMKDINQNKTLTQMGVDSLILSEINQTFKRNFSITLNVKDIRNLTFSQIEKLVTEGEKMMESTPGSERM